MGVPARALILAAGIGSRLRPLTERQPKALVEVGGTSMLERLLRICADAGLHEAVVVTGHAHEAIDQRLEQRGTPLAVRTVYNPEYATLNNAHSVWTARDAIGDQGFVQFDGDLLVHPLIVEQLLRCSWPSALAVDHSVALDPEAMKAAVDETGRITALGKWLDVADASGEAIGVAKIAADHSARLFDAIEQLVHRDGRGDAYYEDVYHALLDDGWPLGASDTGGYGWTEIDDAADLAAAQTRLAELEP